MAVARRRPQQERAVATREAIFAAAVGILETEGEAALTTNRIAEVAGMSIGRLYQYFADKQAILVAMAHDENVATRAKLSAAIAARPDIPPARHAIRLQIAAMPGRPNTRRAMLKAVLAAESAQAVAGAGGQDVGIEDFVLTHAVTGVIRSAVLEDAPFLRDPRFEDALVRLIEGYRS